jgi:hypothetical protein
VPAGTTAAATDFTTAPAGAGNRNGAQVSDAGWESTAAAGAAGPAEALAGVKRAPAIASGTPAAAIVRSLRFVISP